MQNVGKETCAVENDVNMNAEDDEKTTSEAERARNYSPRRNVASSISPMYEWNTLDEERDRERRQRRGVHARHLIGARTFVMDVSEYREGSRFTWHRQRISSCMRDEFIGTLSRRPTPRTRARSPFLPLLAGVVSLNLPCLFFAPSLVARCYGVAPRAILISAASID